MSVTLAHSFRVDSAGRAVTVEQGSGRHAAEAAGHVLACGIGERGLAPLWGLTEPVGGPVDPDEVRAVLSFCDPALAVSRVDVESRPDGQVFVDVDVDWTSTDEEGSL